MEEINLRIRIVDEQLPRFKFPVCIASTSEEEFKGSKVLASRRCSPLFGMDFSICWSFDSFSSILQIFKPGTAGMATGITLSIDQVGGVTNGSLTAKPQ